MCENSPGGLPTHGSLLSTKLFEVEAHPCDPPKLVATLDEPLHICQEKALRYSRALTVCLWEYHLRERSRHDITSQQKEGTRAGKQMKPSDLRCSQIAAKAILIPRDLAMMYKRILCCRLLCCRIHLSTSHNVVHEAWPFSGHY